jgi:hypothetical protein
MKDYLLVEHHFDEQSFIRLLNIGFHTLLNEQLAGQ